jgi:hypothetical protein
MAIMSKSEKIKAVNKVSKNPFLYTNPEYTYYLTHAFDNDRKNNVLIKSTIEPETMELLIYTFQDIAFDVDDSKDLGQRDVARILAELFDTQIISTDGIKKITAYNIDLYDNWECWTGVGGEILAIKKLKNEKVKDLIEEIFKKSA